MPFTVTPNSVSSATDRPLSFRYQFVGDSTVFRAKVEVLISATVVATYYEDPISQSGADPNITYTWDIDVQRIMARRLPPFTNAKTRIFPSDTDGGYNTSTRDYDPTYFVKVTPLKLDVNGLVVDAGASETSSSKAVNAIWQDEEGENFLDKFYSDNPKHPLIDRDEIEICLDEIFQLVYYDPGAADQNLTFVVEKYYKAGGFTSHNVVISRVGGYMILGAGTRDVAIDETMAHYIIKRTGFVDIQFNVNDSCCKDDSMRLSWMNQRGGYDAYTFNYRKIRKSLIESKQERRGLKWNNGIGTHHTRGQKGLVKVNIEELEMYELQSRGDLVEDDLVWMKQMFSSPEVYAEIDGIDYLVPIFIENGDDVIIDSSDRVNLFIQAKAIVANVRITHSN